MTIALLLLQPVSGFLVGNLPILVLSPLLSLLLDALLLFSMLALALHLFALLMHALLPFSLKTLPLQMFILPHALLFCLLALALALHLFALLIYALLPLSPQALLHVFILPHALLLLFCLLALALHLLALLMHALPLIRLLALPIWRGPMLRRVPPLYFGALVAALTPLPPIARLLTWRSKGPRTYTEAQGNRHGGALQYMPHHPVPPFARRN